MNTINPIRALALTVMVMFFVSSCKGKDEVQKPDAPVLSITPSVNMIAFAESGSTALVDGNSVDAPLTFTVETNQGQWDITQEPEASWVILARDENAGQFTLSAPPFSSDSPPDPVEITVRAGDAEPVVIAVTQNFNYPLKPPSHVVMNFRRDPKTQMAFNWLTDPGAFTGSVEIVQGTATSHSAFATPYKTVHATADNITDLRYSIFENRSYMIHKALAEDLTPATTYSYRVGYEGSWSEIGTFTTAANDVPAFTFLYTTDPQSTTSTEFQTAAATVTTAYNLFPDVKFLLTCGDLVNQRDAQGDVTMAWEWEQFFGTQQDIFYKLPFAPVMGNHDAYMPNSFIYYFNLEPQPVTLPVTPIGKPGSVYSFVYGDVLFMGLNTENYNVTGYSAALGNWMRAEVNKPEHTHVKWRIAFFHRALYTGGPYQGDAIDQLNRNALAPVFDELGIDIALQGHNHVYNVIGSVYNKALVPGSATQVTSTTVSHPVNSNGKSGGVYSTANGTLYFANSASGEKRYDPTNPLLSGYGVTDYPSLFTGRLGQPGSPAYSRVSVTHDEITIATYTVASNNSVPFDEIKVKKP